MPHENERAGSAFLIEKGYLERVADIVVNGRTVLASRLGYRITKLFADHFLGRIFENPDAIFTEQLLRPEKQDPAAFVEGVDAMVDPSGGRVYYFHDGSVGAPARP